MSDDRTKADKAWEARQEAARYRIFNDSQTPRCSEALAAMLLQVRRARSHPAR